MSQPCCFAHHRVTAESMPPERRMIARSMGRTVDRRRDARRAAPGRRLPTHKYLSQARPTGYAVTTSSGGGRGQVVRVPQDLEFVLDSLDRFALPLSEPLAIPVAKDREQMAQAVYDGFGFTRGHQDRDDESRLVAHDKPVISEGHLMHLAVPLAECLADEGRDRRDHAPDHIPVLVRHQGSGHVFDEEAVGTDHEDL